MTRGSIRYRDGGGKKHRLRIATVVGLGIILGFTINIKVLSSRTDGRELVGGGGKNLVGFHLFDLAYSLYLYFLF